MPVDRESLVRTYGRVFGVIGRVVYAALALFIAFSHCSRISPAPHFHPMTAILPGPFGLMPFHGVAFAKFALSVGLGVGLLFIVALTSNPRRRVLAAAVSVATWILPTLLVLEFSSR